jgi:hypothetical protein
VSRDLLDIVVGQLTELVLDTAFHLVPLSLHFIPIHEFKLLNWIYERPSSRARKPVQAAFQDVHRIESS